MPPKEKITRVKKGDAGAGESALAVAAKAASASTPDVGEIVYNILDTLANLSATDSWHDFHGDISRFREVILDNEKIYCEGLPLGVTSLGEFNDEGLALNNVIFSRDGNRESDYGQKLVTYNTGEFEVKQDPYTIKTINNSEYSVRPFVVAHGSSKTDAGKTYTNAINLVSGLELESDSAIIIDATAVSILTILKSGDAVMDGKVRKKIYYVLTPEVVNDPAGKTSVAEKIFDPSSTTYVKGVELIGCEPNVPESINYNYSYDKAINSGTALKNKSTNPYDKFFSAFNFQLSEVQRNRKGKKTDYTTNLLIKSNDKRIPVPENVQDSKTKNNITFLTSLIKNAISMLGKKQDTLTNRFLFNTKLQQKRSGDWLQVLACAVLKSRALKQYNPPGTAPREQEIEKKITKVYFITHDRVALAFALLLGVECIYTHAKTKSCYIFKSASPADLETANVAFLQNKKAELTEIKRKITLAKSDFFSYQTPQHEAYYNFRRANIENKYPAAIKSIGAKYNSLFIENADKTFNATDFTKFTCETFELALLYDYLLLNFPDLSIDFNGIVPTIDKLIEIINDKLPIIDQGIAESTAAAQALSSGSAAPPTTYNFAELKNNINNAISIFNLLMARLSTLQTSLDKYVLDELPWSIKIKLETTITNFQKSPNRKLASGWSWDNTQGNSRMWEAFKDMVGIGSYKSDKNLFLYNLNLLPHDTKAYLCEKYLEIQDIINKIPAPNIVENVGKNPAAVPMPVGGRLTKFNIVTKGFIAEIFLNFGFKIPEPRSRDTVSSSTSPASSTSSLSPASSTGSLSPASLPPYSDAEYCLNGDYEVSIKRVLTTSDAGPLSEDAILSENGQATIISATDENYPENLVKDVTPINYSTEVTASDSGRPITDSEATSKTVEELTKNKNEATDIIESVGADASDIQKSSLRSGLDDDAVFKAERNAAAVKALPRKEGAAATEGSSPLRTDTGELASDVKSDIINSTENDIRETVSKKSLLDAELEGASAVTHDETDDSFRKAIEPRELIDTEIVTSGQINIRKGAKLLGSDFEPNIKDATYVLLNAILGYKCTPEQLAVFQDKIYEIAQSNYIRPADEIANQSLPPVVQELGVFHDEGEIENRKRLEEEAAAELEAERESASSSGAGGVAVLPAAKKGSVEKASSGAVSLEPGIIQLRLREKYARKPTIPLDSLQSLPQDIPPPPPPRLWRMLGLKDSLQGLPPKGKGGMAGGAGPETDDLLLAFFESLDLPSIESGESMDGDENENFFKSVNYLFHPLLPIYMFAESLNEISGNDHIEESLDYEIYQNYLKFLEQLRESVVQQYASKQPLDVAKAFMIGTCLREFLFYSDVYSLDAKTSGQAGGRREIPNSAPSVQSGPTVEQDDALIDVGKGKEDEFTEEYHPEEYFEFEQPHPVIPGETESLGPETAVERTAYCEDVLGMSRDEFLPVSILTGVFNYFISGIQTRSVEDNDRGKKMLQSELFSNFMRNVNMGNKFREIIDEPEPISSFKRKCFVFLLETGNIIITDRGGVPLEIPTEEETNALHPDAEGRRELMASAAEARRASNGYGGSKKNRVNKNRHITRRNGKTTNKTTRVHRKLKVKRNTKRN
jgi:hypothetical protein